MLHAYRIVCVCFVSIRLMLICFFVYVIGGIGKTKGMIVIARCAVEMLIDKREWKLHLENYIGNKKKLDEDEWKKR